MADLLPPTTFLSQRSPSTSTRHQDQPLNPQKTIYSMTTLSPCPHQAYSPSRQIRPGLMLAQRPRRSRRPSWPPLMTPALESLEPLSLSSRSSVTIEEATSTYRAPQRNHRALNSLTVTRSTEPLGWKLHFMARLAGDHAASQRTFKHSPGLAATGRLRKLVLPRFVNKPSITWWRLPGRPRYAQHLHDRQESLLTLHRPRWPLRRRRQQLTGGGTRATIRRRPAKVRTKSSQSSRITSDSLSTGQRGRYGGGGGSNWRGASGVVPG